MTCESTSASYGTPEPMMPIEPSMFHEQRKRLVEAYHKAGIQSGIIVLKGGDQPSRHDTDVGPVFRQESYFYYLFGCEDPCEYGQDYYGAIDVATGICTFFIAQFPSSFGVWMGALKVPEDFAEALQFEDVRYSSELTAWLNSKADEAHDGTLTIYLLNGKNTDSDLMTVTTPTFEGLQPSLSTDKIRLDYTILHPILSNQRSIKTQKEQDIMRYVCRVSSRAHVHVMRVCRPGWFQHQLESSFLHHVYFHGGCRHVSYTCICATGTDSAVLHYTQNEKKIVDGQMALLDMGAEYRCYASDITCSFPANGTFSSKQKLIYTAVLEAQKAVFGSVRPGIPWIEMHQIALRVICEHLFAANIISSGNWEMWCAAGIPAIFQPHGLGHLLGLDVHDVGGIPPNTERPKEPHLCKLRNLRVLENGMAITVEPGIYFNHVLLEAAFANPLQMGYLNEALIRAEYWDFGGIRIEDDILITQNGCENMTICPREINDIEAIMKSRDTAETDADIFEKYATKNQRIFINEVQA